MPSISRRRNRPISSLKDVEDMLFQRPPVLRTSDTRAQFLRDYHTEILERREYSMKLLERFVGGAIAKALDEELRIENVLASRRRHRSGSGDVI